jgi:hypothetical protein
MTERSVDVMDSSGNVLHTYPVTLGESDIAVPEALNTKPRRWKRPRTVGLSQMRSSVL